MPAASARDAADGGDRSGEMMMLQVLAVDQHVCVAQVEGPHEIRRRIGVGQVFPLHRDTTVKGFRAYRKPASHESRALVHADALPREIPESLAAGYASSIEKRERGASATSAAIFDAEGRVWAALTIAGPAQRFGPAQMRQFADPVLEAARALSLEQGYPAGNRGVSAARTSGREGNGRVRRPVARAAAADQSRRTG